MVDLEQTPAKPGSEVPDSRVACTPTARLPILAGSGLCAGATVPAGTPAAAVPAGRPGNQEKPAITHRPCAGPPRAAADQPAQARGLAVPPGPHLGRFRRPQGPRRGRKPYPSRTALSTSDDRLHGPSSRMVNLRDSGNPTGLSPPSPGAVPAFFVQQRPQSEQSDRCVLHHPVADHQLSEIFGRALCHQPAGCS